jgi:hypothetical protein
VSPLSRRRRRVLLGVVVVLAGLAAFVLVYFQPQKLFYDDTVDEPVPVAEVTTEPSPTEAATASSPRPKKPPAQPTVLSQGKFHSGEHETTGDALVLRLDDGRTFVRLDDLRTSNGPALHVWLTSADAFADDGTIDDATHLDLGGLKGNIGDQNYLVPSGTDLHDYQAVVVWCERFHVSFGAAPLSLDS